ncbi:MAG: TonB-dependent receptor [Pseudomonadota bacterium]
MLPQIAAAQSNTAPPEPAPAPAAPTADEAAEAAPVAEAIIVTGIRSSLRESMNIKKNAQGVVDAISAEDIGKFPDTNLAESLQRITGVSIDRSNGEGSTVTVRGFGPEYNLVLLNGRQMPTSSLGDGASPPSSRSFDFANLASEAVAAVEVYKTGRASLPTGGIGSVINIITPRPLSRPGTHFSVAAKTVLDTSRNGSNKLTPEFSGIFSKTFADGRIGILINGSYQRRKGSVNQADIVYHRSFLGSENNWGTLSYGPETVNRPGPNDVYQVPQNALYNITDIDRERINGQAVLQVRPVDSLTATFDYTLSTNRIKSHTDTIGTWFNYGNNASAWTDGPTPGPVYYSEFFNYAKDLSYQGTQLANRSINHSAGGNLAWKSDFGLRVELDAHHSTAESKPTGNYGSSNVIGTAVFGQASQTLDYRDFLPVISYTMSPGIDPLNPANVQPTGSSFRNAYMRDRINEATLRGGYDFDSSIIDSLDFGVTATDNKVRSAFGVLQTDDWGAVRVPPGNLPADLFYTVNIPSKFDGMSGANNPALVQQILGFDFDKMADYLENLVGICSASWSGTAQPGTCLANYTTDRRIREKSVAPYLQLSSTFDLFNHPAHLRAGLRYERTRITSSALVPVPTSVVWVASNEFQAKFASSGGDFTTLKGKYSNLLPAIDFDMSPLRDVKLRASYSHTITRPDYASMQGGIGINFPVRIGGNAASVGNPDLLPYKSKNIDLSAEWYYGPSSYVSAGFFQKTVSNYIESVVENQNLFGLRTPFGGVAYNAAIGALGAGASFEQIKAYIATNYPSLIDPATGGIQAGSGDPLIDFAVTTRRNSDERAKIHGFEFAIQHNFWNTGFGAILNYTIVRGNSDFNNALPLSVRQFAVSGLSDSANAVLFYDKHNIQARIAYNWRDEFLTGFNEFGDPLYVDPYGQVDASASYEFRKGLSLFGEVINLTGAKRRGHTRAEEATFFATKGEARYALGVRATF